MEKILVFFGYNGINSYFCGRKQFVIEKIPMDKSIDFSREIIFASSNKSVSRQIGKAEKAGKLKKLRLVSIRLTCGIRRSI